MTTTPAITVVSFDHELRDLARAFFGVYAYDELIDSRRCHLLCATTDAVELTLTDPIDGTVIVTCRHFATDGEARAFVRANGVPQ